MHIRLRAIAVLCAAFFAHNAVAQTTATAPATSTNPALHESSRGGWWMTKHNAVLERNKQGNVDLIFLGDSITQNYEKHQPPHEDFLPTWDKFYGDRHAENLGFSADQTGHVLWRLDHGEVDGIMPKVAVILIGTNNTSAGQTAEQTTEGIEAVVAKTHEKLPAAKILLLAILPSELPAPPNKSATDDAVNKAIAAAYQGSAYVTVLDIGRIFFKDGKLDWSIFYDPTLPPIHGVKRGPLHPDTQGQRLMAEAIEPTLARLFGDAPKISGPATTAP